VLAANHCFALDSGEMNTRRAAALDAQVVAATHIRDCARCSRIFGVAYDEAGKHVNIDASGALAFVRAVPNVFRVTADIWLELRSCPNWPDVK